MLAAAQAAAEEALRAALAQEGRQVHGGANASALDARQRSGSFSQPKGAGSATSRPSQSELHESEREHFRLMNEVMQATAATSEPLLERTGGGGDNSDQQVALLQEMMGLQQQLSPNDPMTSQLLQLLTQQGRKVQQLQSAGVAPPTRLEEHYLTIAQNGTVLVRFCFRVVACRMQQ
jgi:hypothetical protein